MIGKYPFSQSSVYIQDLYRGLISSNICKHSFIFYFYNFDLELLFLSGTQSNKVKTRDVGTSCTLLPAPPLKQLRPEEPAAKDVPSESEHEIDSSGEDYVDDEDDETVQESFLSVESDETVESDFG
jgi:hypothetical protein